MERVGQRIRISGETGYKTEQNFVYDLRLNIFRTKKVRLGPGEGS